jgi:hypothetical protein
MTALEAALLEVVAALESAHVPYMVIGGLANLYWGRPRLTEDIDVTVWVHDEALADFVAALGKRLKLLAPAPLDFARATRVVPVATSAGPRADVVLGALPYERSAIGRAVEIAIGPRAVRFATAEDLILHKLASERARDREDVEGVVARQAERLDHGYLDPLVEQLAAGLEKPEIAQFYKACVRQARSRPAPGG